MSVARPADPAPRPADRAAAIAGAVLLGLLALLGAGLLALVLLARDDGQSGAAAGPTPRPGGYAYVEPREAPPLELTDQDGAPFAFASLRGRPALVFFGYTHCPDVCPTTIGVVNEAIAAAGPGPRAVFVSIDPERDDAAAMKSYLRYLPPAYVGLSGTPETIRVAADAWGVQYAKVETGSAGGYAMAHTADLYLVDAQGRLRASFPFGTDSAPIASALRELLRETPPPSEPPATPYVAQATPAGGAATPAPATAAPAGTGAPVTPASADIRPAIVSTSIWSGGSSPVIFTLTDGAGTPLDGSVAVRAHLAGLDGTPAGPDVDGVPVVPQGETGTSFVAVIDVPSAGPWRLAVATADGRSGSVSINVLDPGDTAPLGASAPDVATPTLEDVGGIALAVTTVPQPDLRLSRTSTAEARAAGKPYVLVVDSARFKVSPACGRALSMVRFMLDRWTDVPFVHLEPFEYAIVTSEPVLGGPLTDPPVNRYARAWGLGSGAWDGTKMPWVFVVDGAGTVRAKYTGIVGSADVDVILALLAAETAAAG